MRVHFFAWSVLLIGGVIGGIAYAQHDEDESAITERGVTISYGGRIVDFADVLRREHGIPLSVIAVSLVESESEASPSFKIASVRGRLVLLPEDSGILSQVVSGVHIRRMPRMDAARRYVTHLEARGVITGLLSPIMRGNPDATIYSDSVTLSESATVLEHLAELLGDDRSAYFSIVRAESGKPIILLGRVRDVK